jgi:ATPase subunit of ABC transporter with duplicated ATPase domains
VCAECEAVVAPGDDGHLPAEGNHEATAGLVGDGYEIRSPRRLDRDVVTNTECRSPRLLRQRFSVCGPVHRPSGEHRIAPGAASQQRNQPRRTRVNAQMRTVQRDLNPAIRLLRHGAQTATWRVVQENMLLDGRLAATMDGVLQARDLSVEVGGRLTLVEATFTVRAGDKVGLVGRNGAGKTSLLKVLAGESVAAAGAVLRQGALGYLLQEARPRGAGVEATALSHILSGRGLDVEAQRIEKLRLRLEEDPSDRNVARYARAEEDFRAAGGYSAESDVRRICAGLGLAADRVDIPVDVLSGGERRRVELARILFAGSDVLLLDEPTNHLDTDAKTWLMGFLRSYRGALLVVSHDLNLLDEAITRVLHLDEGDIVEYKGTYSQYRNARAKDEERLGKLALRQQGEIKRLADLADSMRHSTAKRARIAKSLDKRVDRLRDVAVEGPTKEKRMALRLPDPPHAGRVVLEASDITKGYGGPAVFSDVSFAVERGERLLIMGLNGAGKTSLLRILAGVTDADAGSFDFGVGVSCGYYAQEHEGIHAGVTVLDHVRHLGLSLEDERIRSLLGMFGLTGEKAFQDASTLSGGEKTRLALAQLVAGRHNLLLLDEPTNNLDPPSRTAIATALAGWPGSMVLVSHDPEFVQALEPQRVLSMPEGTLDYWDDELLQLVSLA